VRLSLIVPTLTGLRERQHRTIKRLGLDTSPRLSRRARRVGSIDRPSAAGLTRIAKRWAGC